MRKQVSGATAGRSVESLGDLRRSLTLFGNEILCQSQKNRTNREIPFMSTGLAKPPMVLVFLFALLLQPRPSTATSVLGLDVNPATQGEFPEYFMVTNGVYGWSFELIRPLTVTGLAWFDKGAEGLAHSHEIGIWQDTTNSHPLLASAVIPAGTNAQLVAGVWRSVDLGNPVTLPAGYFTIGGTYYTENPDLVMFTPPPLLSDSRIEVGIPVFSSSASRGVPPDPLFQEPDSGIVATEGAELGPNLLIRPETPTLQLAVFDNLTVLSWPVWASNYVAEEAQAFGTSASWSALTNATTTSNEMIVQTNGIGSAVSFYRLRKL